MSSYETLSTAADTPAGSHLVLLGANSREVIVELTVADFQTESVAQAGQTYQHLIVPGLEHTVAPGAPQIPVRGEMVGLASPSDVAVEILAAEVETLPGYRLYPAPGLARVEAGLRGWREVFALDHAIYSTDAFYPGQPVELGQVSLLRDQAAVQLRFYPLQYNPVRGEVRFYRRLQVRISWDDMPDTEKSQPRGSTPAYEALLRRLLLNYEALDRPPVAPSPGLSTGTGRTIGATAGPGRVKIGVTMDGLYEVRPADLPVGFDLTGVDIDTVKITNRGTEIPIYMHDDNGNDTFDGSDQLLFYGIAITDIYTTKNIYWLEGGGANGQRMGLRSAPPAGAPVPAAFPVTLHLEKDSHNELDLELTLPGGEEQDTWFWGTKMSPPDMRDYSLVLKDISTTALTAAVRVKLQGLTDPAADPDHHTRLYLNNVVIDDQLWNGRTVFEHQVLTVPHASLIEGSNTLRVEAVGDTGAAVDQFYLNWLEIDYWDRYVAEDNALLFGAPNAGTFEFEVSNFGTPDIALFDLTDPYHGVLMTDTTLVDQGGSYGLQFQDTAQTESRYLALTPAAYKDPASLELDISSSWQDPNHGADYIIITHEDFYTQALSLAAHRSSTGLRVATIKVGDLYDEFNDGIFNPQAIRDFLMYAYHSWTIGPAPTYVLLLGGASYDYRGTREPPLNRENYVPARIVDTDILAQVPTDNWFVQASDSDITPIMLIGRLPAQNSSQAASMVDKIIAYEQNPPTSAWNTETLFVADDGTNGFEIFSQELIDRLPQDYTAHKVYLSANPPDPTADIVNHINNGCLLVNYAGHGSVTQWAGENILNLSTISSLSNHNKLPVVTLANCLNGYFVGQNRAIAERFLQVENKGAVAVWAATGLGYTSGHRVLIGDFYEQIFTNGNHDLGMATTLAKLTAFSQSAFWAEMVETFVLFGDPAMALGLPGGLNTGNNQTYLPVIIRNQ